MAPEISRRHFVTEGVGLGAAAYLGIKKYFDRPSRHDKQKNMERRQALAEELAKNYHFEIQEIKAVLNHLRPGTSESIENLKGEKYFILKSASPNESGRYEITVAVEKPRVL